jgi:hypothetical protein
LDLGEVQEWPAEVRPRDHSPISGRLVITRLPAEEAKEARARVRRELGKQATAQVLRWAGYVMLFTTVPGSRLDAFAIAELYCLRWQIELKFKREKSVGGLDRLPNRRDENIKSWVLAKLLLSELARRVFTSSPVAEPAPGPSSSGHRSRAPAALPIAEHLWECAAMAWSILQSAFLPLDWSDLAGFAQRFRAHLSRLKRKDDPLQVARFLAFLETRSGDNPLG